MTGIEKQTTDTLLLVRPANFGFNEQTAESCPLQQRIPGMSDAQIHINALAEFDTVVRNLQDNALNLIIAQDTPNPKKPDAVFPNNWVTFHEDGTVVLYPMMAEIRRLERRMDIVGDVCSGKGYRLSRILNLTSFEKKGQFLEGTGSMVLDRTNRIAYSCISPRTHLAVLKNFAKKMDYEYITFHTLDKLKMPVYHTNVVMSLGEKFALICLDAIPKQSERKKIVKSLLKTDHDVIPISIEQLYNFAGNVLQVSREDGEDMLIMSTRAFGSFGLRQKEVLRRYCNLIISPARIIETISGGSVRCMLAEVFKPAA